jgi:hypothetical protein
MTDHRGYERHAQEGRDGSNSRNGKTNKRVKTDTQISTSRFRVIAKARSSR